MALQVLEYYRDRHQWAKDVPDDELVEYVAERNPELLLEDDEFRVTHSKLTTPRSPAMQPTMQVAPGEITGPDFEHISDAPVELPTTPGEVAEGIQSRDPAAQPYPVRGAQTPEELEAVKRDIQRQQRNALIVEEHYKALKDLAGGDPAKEAAAREARIAAYEDLGFGVVKEGSLTESLAPVPKLDTKTVQKAFEGQWDMSENTAATIAGIQRGVAGAVDFLTSPLGIATMGMGAAPKAAQRAVSSMFAGEMIRHMPESVVALGHAIEEGDVEGALEIGTGAALTLLFATKATEHALGIESGMSPLVKQRVEKAAKMLDKAVKNKGVKSALEEFAKDEALRQYDPQNAMVKLAENPLTRRIQTLEAPKPKLMEAPNELKPRQEARIPDLKKSPKAERVEEAPGTITGSNERIGSEMPAEPEAGAPRAPGTGPGSSSPPKPVRPRRSIDRPPDILDDVLEVGKINLGSARRIQENFKPKGIARKAFSSKGGLGIDEVLDVLRREGKLSERASEDDLLEFLQNVNQARREFRSQETKINKQIKEQVAQEEAFRRAQESQAKNKEEIPVSELLEGDEFLLQNTKVKVKDLIFDENAELTAVVLEDGRKFGVRTVGAEQLLKYDEGTLKQVEPSTDFLPPGETPPAPQPKPAPAQPEPAPQAPAAQRKAPTRAEANRRLNELAEQAKKRKLTPLEKAEQEGLERALGQEDLLNVPAERTAQEAETARQQQEAQAEIAKRQQKRLTAGQVESQGGFFPEPGQQDIFGAQAGQGGGGAYASFGRYKDNTPALMGHMDKIRPVAFPELTRLAEYLTGSSTEAKRLRRYWGYFKPGGPGKVVLNKDLFKPENMDQLVKTMAHEIGHLIDYLPDRTMSRGNLVGRLRSLSRFLKNTFGTEKIKNSELREELKTLSAEWRPWDRSSATKNQIKYRDSPAELYADAVSVLFNSPGLLETRAPKFYSEFFRHLDKKPTVKAEFMFLQDLLSHGPEAVKRVRVEQSREAFEKGEQMLKEKIAEQELSRRSFEGWRLRLKQEFVDVGEVLTRSVKEVESKGKEIPQWADPRLAWEEMFYGDNRNMMDLRAIHENVVKPVEAAGADMHTLGTVLQLQRETGNINAFRDIQDMAARLGAENLEVLDKAAKVLSKDVKAGLAEATGAQIRVLEILDQRGLTVEDVTALEHHRATAGPRSHIPNPGGMTPNHAKETLDQLLKDLGPEKSQAVLGAAKTFRELVFERVTEGKEVGIYNAETYQNVFVPNRSTYAAFRGLDHVDTFVTPMARRGKGTLKDIENPFLTTMLKVGSLNNLILVQKAKIAARDFYGKHFPDSFKPARTYWDGKQRSPRAPAEGLERLNVLENGRPVAYDVDPYIAEAFAKLTPAEISLPTKLLNVAFRNGIYPLIIKYNPGFQFAFNPYRDFKRSARNLGAIAGVSRWELLKHYKSAFKSARSFARGKPDPLAQELLSEFAIGTPFDGFNQLDRVDVFGDLLKKYRVMGEAQKSKIKNTLLWLPRRIEYAGSILEALPKFAAYKSLVHNRQWDPRAAAAVTRTYVGTPAYKVKGKFGNVANQIVPFTNIFVQGYRADFKLAFTPKTAGGWWFRWMLNDGSKAVLVGLAAAGVFGEEIKRLYDGVSEYDKSNYTVIPLGFQTGGEHGQKTIYARLPRDEVSRFLSATTYKLTRLMMGDKDARKFPSEIFDVGAGMVPTITPILQVGEAWRDYARGLNPIDPWRNRPVIPSREYKAGGLPALKHMMHFTVDKSGLLNLFRYNPDADTTTEMVVSGVPVVNRLLKISDYGYAEQQMDVEMREEQIKAQGRLGDGDETRSMLNEFYRLQRLKDQRTPQQEGKYAALNWWYYRVYRRFDEASLLLDQAGETAKAKQLRDGLNKFTEEFSKKAFEPEPPEWKPIWEPFTREP